MPMRNMWRSPQERCARSSMGLGRPEVESPFPVLRGAGILPNRPASGLDPQQVPGLSFALQTSPLLGHPVPVYGRKPQAQEEVAGALIHTGSGARVSRPTGDESPRAASAILRSAKDTDALVSTLASLAVCLLPSLAPEGKHC